MYEHVCAYLQQRRIYLSSQDKKIISEYTGHRFIPRHTIIMEQGKPVKKFYFLNSGIVRLFKVHNGIDHTLGLVSSRDFISTIFYLTNGEPSSCGLETLTDAEVLEWGKGDVRAIKKLIPKAQDIELATMDRLLTWLQDGQIDAICLTAEERYQKLMLEQPEIIQTVPLKYIASFLGIHQDSLSRIRKIVVQKL